MADPIRVHEMHIGGQTRSFKFNHTALRLAQHRYNNTPVMDLLQRLDWGVLCELAAFGLTGYGDRKATPDRVGQWLEDEPEKYAELQKLVSKGIIETYARTLPAEDAAELGKNLAAVEAAAAAVEAQAKEAKRKKAEEEAMTITMPAVTAPSGTDGPTSSA